MSTDWSGRIVEVSIERVAHGGHCVGRVDSRVVFVRHALPGEVVRARITEDRGGSFCRADAIEVVSAAPGRVTAPCEFSGPAGCGGCDWQHASAATQRELKADVVAEQLSRLAGIERRVEVEEVQPSPTGWRTRMQYAVDGDHVGLRAHRSHHIIDIDTCHIADPRADIDKARPFAAPSVSGVEIDAGDGAPIVHTVDARRRRRAVSGNSQMHRVGEHQFRVRAGGFWQVHARAADVLTDVVLQYADAQHAEDVLDLYSGVGLFSVPLSVAVGGSGSVLAIEGSAAAVADAQHNLAAFRQAKCQRLDIRAPALRKTLGSRRFDVTVLDPPRTGAKPALCGVIAEHTRRAIVYVACDPAALARDLAAFADLGWKLDELRAFDMFPMTHHVECVALLTKTQSDMG